MNTLDEDVRNNSYAFVTPYNAVIRSTDVEEKNNSRWAFGCPPRKFTANTTKKNSVQTIYKGYFSKNFTIEAIPFSNWLIR